VAVRAHEQMVMSETLARELRFMAPGGAEAPPTTMLDDVPLHVGVERLP